MDACIEQQQQIWGAVAEAVQTLSEASDIIWEGWQARTHAEDISAEQWTDTYRGVERLYDPGTGEVCYRHSIDRGVIWPFSIPRGKGEQLRMRQLAMTD